MGEIKIILKSGNNILATSILRSLISNFDVKLIDIRNLGMEIKWSLFVSGCARGTYERGEREREKRELASTREEFDKCIRIL